MAVTITTNNVPRDVVYGYELPEEARKQFDYLSWDEDEVAGYQFVRYKGDWIDLGEFEVIRGASRDTFPGWHGSSMDTYFSGLLVRYVDETTEQVVLGRFYV